MGIIEEDKRGKDGLVRSVVVRLAPLKGRKQPRFFERAISDVVLLVPSANHPC